MKRIALGLAVAALAAALAAPALAAGPGRGHGALRHLKAFAALPGHFVFVGNLQSTPGAGASAVTIVVSGGDREALRKLLGQSTTQTFAVSGDTKVVKTRTAKATLADLAQGDLVRLEIRAPRNASLADIAKQPAKRVLDRGQLQQGERMATYVFRGTLTSVGSSTLSLDVKGGTVPALRLMIAQPAAQTFAFSSSTKFLRLERRHPAQAAATDLKAGDRVEIAVRASSGATLAEVEAAAAVRVVALAPAASEFSPA